jgi:hypothetical protein
MPRNNNDFNSGQSGEADNASPVASPKSGSLHKGRSGYYEEHHSSTRYIGGCRNCMREEKSGKHPLA